MLTRYFEAAMSHAAYEWLEGDRIFAGTIPGLEGVIGTGETNAECAVDLREALEHWVSVGLRFGDEIPEVDGINPNVKLTA
jgi:predicted RNase H-like HicB family nuclease